MAVDRSVTWMFLQSVDKLQGAIVLSQDLMIAMSSDEVMVLLSVSSLKSMLLTRVAVFHS